MSRRLKGVRCPGIGRFLGVGSDVGQRSHRTRTTQSKQAKKANLRCTSKPRWKRRTRRKIQTAFRSVAGHLKSDKLTPAHEALTSRRTSHSNFEVPNQLARSFSLAMLSG